MKFLFTLVIIAFFSGCATWNGIKKDTSDGVDWTKDKINKGAEYVKEKTE